MASHFAAAPLAWLLLGAGLAACAPLPLPPLDARHPASAQAPAAPQPPADTTLEDARALPPLDDAPPQEAGRHAHH
jgi:hypothetical protein